MPKRTKQTSEDLRDPSKVVPFKAVQSDQADFFQVLTMMLSSLSIVLRIPLAAWGAALFALASIAHRRRTSQVTNPYSSVVFAVMSVVMSYVSPRLKPSVA
ncbi:hypothetical protein P9112_007972 [Eukaryota sp. TZLM1-RC]